METNVRMSARKTMRRMMTPPLVIPGSERSEHDPESPGLGYLRPRLSPSSLKPENSTKNFFHV
jgi:hypothetical protein